jgi:hypothetical protein
MNQLRQMPAMRNAGEDWDEGRKSEIITRVIDGTLTVRDAGARYGLSPECIRDWVLTFRRSALHALDDHLRQTLVSQGLCADDLSAAAFSGALEEMAIADLLQMIEFWRKDGVITVFHDFQESRIWCSSGAIADAESGKLRGERAVHRILALEQGRVVVDFCSIHRAKIVQPSTVALLMDAARRKDECGVLNRRLGDYLYRLGSNPRPASATLSLAEAAVLRAFEAPRSVAGVVAESPLGDLETLQVISELVERGQLARAGKASMESIVPSASEEVSGFALAPIAPQPASPRRVQRSRSARRRLALALALCGLGIAGWFVPRGLFSSSNEHGTKAPAFPHPTLAPGTLEARPSPPELREPARSPAPEASSASNSDPVDPPPLRMPEAAGTPASSVPPAAGLPSHRRRPPANPSAPAAPAKPPLPTKVESGAGVPEQAPLPASATSEEPQPPRMRIIDEEPPAMRVLE